MWKKGDNKFGGSDHSDGQKVIADVLNQVRDAIKASEDEVNANNKADLATVQEEFDAARAATKGRFDKEIQRMADEVEAARKLKVAKMAHHDHTVSVMNGKQRVFDDKAQDLVERQEQQRVEGQFARDTHDANVQAADTYLVQRNSQINSDADDDACGTSRRSVPEGVPACICAVPIHNTARRHLRYPGSQECASLSPSLSHPLSPSPLTCLSCFFRILWNPV